MHADFGQPFAIFRHTKFPHYYRCHEEGESEEEFATRMADALDALTIAEGPDTVAAFIAEPMMGAGGAILPPRTYFAKIEAVLRKYDVLFIADEALLVDERIYQAMLVESGKLGNFAHRYTCWAHPVAAAVALEVQRIYEEMDFVGHVKRVGAHMQQALGRLAEHPLVGDVRGVGLLAGLDIVADKETRAMFDPTLQVPAIIERNLKKHALILRQIGNRIGLSPPVVITESEVDDLVLVQQVQPVTKRSTVSERVGRVVVPDHRRLPPAGVPAKQGRCRARARRYLRSTLTPRKAHGRRGTRRGGACRRRPH